MAMSRRARIWTIILAIPVALMVIGVVAAKLYFTKERLKALVIPKLEQATHRTVTLADISLSIFPLGVSIDSLQISNPPDVQFDAPAFLALDHASLNMKFFPLIGGRVEIGSVVLNRPKIYIETSEEGRKNYTLSDQRNEIEEVKKQTEGPSGGLFLENLEIHDGILQTLDKKFDSRMLIVGLNQSGSMTARKGENNLIFTGTTAIEKFSYGDTASWYISDQPVTATEELTYDLVNDVLRFDKVEAKMRELPLAVTGTIAGLQKKSLQLDIGVDAPNVQMSQLLSLIPPEMLKATKGLSSSGDVTLALTITGESSETMNPATKATFSVANGKIQYASLPKSITNINLKGTFEKPAAPVGKKDIGELSIDPFTAALGDNPLSGMMTVKHFSSPMVNAKLDGSINLDEVKDYYPLDPGSNFSGVMRAHVSIAGQPKVQQSLKADGTVELQNVTIQTAGSKQPIKNLNGTIAFNNQVVESKQLALTIGESDMNLAFTLRNYLGMVLKDSSATAGKPTMTAVLNSKQLRTADLMGSEEPGQSTSGSAAQKKEGGLLPGFNVAATMNVARLVTEKFTFENVQGALGIANGIINLENVSVRAFNGVIKSRGTLDVRNDDKRPFDLDLQISNVESHSLLPKFTSFGQYLSGKFSTTTKLRGDLNDTLGLRTESLLGNGTVELTDGKLFGFPLTQKLSSVTGLEELREIHFKDWTNAFSISEGRMNVKDLKVNAGQTTMMLEGSHGLDGSMNYQLTVKLPESMSARLNVQGLAGDLLQYFKDKDGRIALPFTVTGSTNDPVVKFNGQDVAQQALERKKQQLIDDAKKKLDEELKKKAGEGLKKLLKKP